MSGHSKWNNIKRKKEKTDGARAKIDPFLREKARKNGKTKKGKDE